MVVLAFDTSTAQGGVAILRDSQVLSRRVWQRQGSHGELLTPQIQECLNEAGLSVRQLDALAVGIGPGSFTGVRVAINAARSLAFAMDLPVYAFDTLEILSNGAGRTDLPLLVMVNAHKNMVFHSTFEFRNGWMRKTEIAAREPDQLKVFITTPHLCIGDGFDEYRDLLSPEFLPLLVRDHQTSDWPQVDVVGNLLKSARPLDWKNIQALYIRESGAEEKLRESRKDK